MIAKIFLGILLCYCGYALIAKEKYHLLMVVFIMASNFFGFYWFLGDKRGDAIFAYLVAISLYFYFFRPYKVFLIPVLRPNLYLIIGFLIFLVISLFVSFVEYNQVVPSLKVFRELFRYASIPLFLYILFHFERSDVDKFLNLLEKVTVVLCFFYVLNFGAGIKIFGVASYGAGAYIGGVQLERNFFAIPQFLGFFLVRLILQEKATKYSISAIFIIFLTAFLTYTRSFVASTVILAVAALIIRNFKYKKPLINLLKVVIIVPIAAVILGVIIGQVFPKQLEFMMMRVGSVDSIESAAEDKNLNLRTEIIKSRARKVLEVNPITGLGFLHVETSGHLFPDLFVRPGDSAGQVVVGDQSWGNLIALIGFGGIIIYLFVFLNPSIWLLRKRIFLKQDITLISGVFFLASALLIQGFISQILMRKYFLLGFILALIIYYANDYLYKPYIKFLEKEKN